MSSDVLSKVTEPVVNDLTPHNPAALPVTANRREGEGLIDVLDRVLDKGLVIAGDIQINLLDIELLTIKVRLLIASADKAREMGIDWWAHDPQLSSRAGKEQDKNREPDGENKKLNDRLDRLEQQIGRLLEQSSNRSASSSHSNNRKRQGAAKRTRH
jgi:hypothetical protein